MYSCMCVRRFRMCMCMRSHIQNHRGRINFFAYDVAIAIAHLERALTGIIATFRQWHKAIGLGLKLPKSSIVMGADT